MTVVIPVEIPGEDVTDAPYAPVPAAAHLTLAQMLPQVAWPDARPTWDDLTPEEQIAELRLGAESEFFDTFADDPVVWWDCPDDGRVVVDVTGTCDACGRVVLS